MHGKNDKHDPNHCPIVKQALLNYKDSVIKKKSLQNPQTTKTQKSTKPLSILNNNNNNKIATKPKVANLSDKTKPKAKANLITTSSQITTNNKTIKLCNICKDTGKSHRAYLTHNSSECSFNSKEKSDQQNDLDSNDEVEEENNETNENEIEESDDSDARHRRRRKISNEDYEANTVDEDDIVLNYNPSSDTEAEET
jgi:hypothetical protein